MKPSALGGSVSNQIIGRPDMKNIIDSEGEIEGNTILCSTSSNSLVSVSDPRRAF